MRSMANIHPTAIFTFPSSISSLHALINVSYLSANVIGQGNPNLWYLSLSKEPGFIKDLQVEQPGESWRSQMDQENALRMKLIQHTHLTPSPSLVFIQSVAISFNQFQSVRTCFGSVYCSSFIVHSLCSSFCLCSVLNYSLCRTLLLSNN